MTFAEMAMRVLHGVSSAPLQIDSGEVLHHVDVGLRLNLDAEGKVPRAELRIDLTKIGGDASAECHLRAAALKATNWACKAAQGG